MKYHCIIITAVIASIGIGCSQTENSISDRDSNISSVKSDTSDHSTAEPESITQQDSIADFKFTEITVRIYPLSVWDPENITVEKINSDTADLFHEYGDLFEGQRIELTTDMLENVTIEERFETSITLSFEGPHCDLIDWKHYDSPWKYLKPESDGAYRALDYSTEETKKFPKISMTELKKEAVRFCGEGSANEITDTTIINEYPVFVDISRYFLRIKGTIKGNGKIVTKIIIIERPMGC